jgi:transcriptional regulator with XRE-family HTH domain
MPTPLPLQRFEALDAWMASQKVTQAELARRLNISKSHANRLCLGQLRLIDPWTAFRLEQVTDGEITVLDYMAFVAECLGKAAA